MCRFAVKLFLYQSGTAFRSYSIASTESSNAYNEDKRSNLTAALDRNLKFFAHHQCCTMEEIVPRDAKTVRGILASMEVSDYDEHVVHQLLELLYRHVSVVAAESAAMARHAGREVADTEDVKLAVRMRCEFTYNAPPNRVLLARLASEVNSQPLPAIEQKAGVAIPPRRRPL